MANKYKIIFSNYDDGFWTTKEEIINIDFMRMTREELDIFANGYCWGLEKAFGCYWGYEIQEVTERNCG